MSLPTLYAPRIGHLPPGETVDLDPEEARHLKALRIRAGDAVRVTDGDGTVALAELSRTGRQWSCVLRKRLAATPPVPVDLAFPVANRERTLWLVEKAVELGVREMHLLECDRSRSVADAARSDAFRKRAGRRALAALKQSGGAHLPTLHPVTPLAAWLEGKRAGSRLLASETADRSMAEWLCGRERRDEVSVLVGPEGGLTEEEIAACRAAGLVPVRLGARTLRFETAALAALAILGLHYDLPGPSVEPEGARKKAAEDGGTDE